MASPDTKRSATGEMSPSTLKKRQITLNPLFQGVLAQPQQSSLPLRHIVLPFDLRVDPDAFEKSENRDILASIFPDNYGLSMDGMFLLFFQTKIPPKPWPKTIAGLLPYFAPRMSPQHMPRPFGALVHPRNSSIAQDQNGRDMKDWEPLFDAVKKHFQGLGISFTEVMYWGNYLVIVLEHRHIDMAKLPHMAANIICTYSYDDEMGRPLMPQAGRLIDPTPGNPDNSEYSTLQPGLRLTSAYLPSKPGIFLSTTAGVLVKDGAGNEFMTAASHGFPGGCGTTVIHPLPAGGRDIGELIMEVTHTDIALVTLRDAEKFSNITFQDDDIVEPVQLKRLASVKGRRSGDRIFLDSPDTGCLEGSFLFTSFQRVPSDDHGLPEQRWMLSSWYYTGQDSASDLPDRMCGSAIWTGDGDVLGFFTYAPKDGVMKDWCVGIAADELMNRGFTLVDTTNRQAP